MLECPKCHSTDCHSVGYVAKIAFGGYEKAVCLDCQYIGAIEEFEVKKPEAPKLESIQGCDRCAD